MSLTFKSRFIKSFQTTSTTEDVLDILLRAGLVPLLEGPTGVGKSQMIREYGNARGYDVLTLEAANMDPAEAVGRMVERKRILPNGKEEFYHQNTIPTWLNTILENEEEGKPTILFLDEINRGPLVKDQMMSLLLERRFGINERKLPDSTLIIAAQNPDDGNYSVESMDPAQASRLVKVKITPSFVHWKNAFALQYSNGRQNIHPMIVEYLENFPKEFIVSHNEEFDDVGMNPRRWEMASSALYIIESQTFSQGVISNVTSSILGLSSPGFLEFYTTKDTMTLKTFSKIAYEKVHEMGKSLSEILKSKKGSIDTLLEYLHLNIYDNSELMTRQNLLYSAVEAYHAKILEKEIAALIFMISSNENIAVINKLNPKSKDIIKEVMVTFFKATHIEQKKRDAALNSLIDKIPALGTLLENRDSL